MRYDFKQYLKSTIKDDLETKGPDFYLSIIQEQMEVIDNLNKELIETQKASKQLGENMDKIIDDVVNGESAKEVEHKTFEILERMEEVENQQYEYLRRMEKYLIPINYNNLKEIKRIKIDGYLKAVNSKLNKVADNFKTDNACKEFTELLQILDMDIISIDKHVRKDKTYYFYRLKENIVIILDNQKGLNVLEVLEELKEKQIVIITDKYLDCNKDNVEIFTVSEIRNLLSKKHIKNFDFKDYLKLKLYRNSLRLGGI